MRPVPPPSSEYRVSLSCTNSAFEIAEYGTFSLTLGAAPKFEPDHWAPTGFSIGKGTHDPFTNRFISFRPQKMNPRGCVDQNQRLSFAT
jgi:hypothetical protein